MSRFLIGTSAVPEIARRQPARKPRYPWQQILDAHRDTYFQVEVVPTKVNNVQPTVATSGNQFCAANAPDLKVVSRRMHVGSKLVLRFWLKDKTWGQREVEQEQPQERQVAAAVA